jgi:hypothetical protein
MVRLSTIGPSPENAIPSSATATTTSSGSRAVARPAPAAAVQMPATTSGRRAVPSRSLMAPQIGADTIPTPAASAARRPIDSTDSPIDP